MTDPLSELEDALVARYDDRAFAWLAASTEADRRAARPVVVVSFETMQYVRWASEEDDPCGVPDARLSLRVGERVGAD